MADGSSVDQPGGRQSQSQRGFWTHAPVLPSTNYHCRQSTRKMSAEMAALQSMGTTHSSPRAIVRIYPFSPSDQAFPKQLAPEL